MVKRYGIFGLYRLIFDKIFTFLYCRNARIIRRPVYIRGKRNINFGIDLTTGVALRIDAFSNIKNHKTLILGNHIELNDYVHIGAVEKIEIGNNVLIASKVFITDHNHGSYGFNNIHDNPNTLPNDRTIYSSPVKIEDNVWIGEFVSVLPGVTIGKGSIIGAMSVVSKSIPPFSIAVGIPAKVIKSFNFETGKWERL